MELYLFSYSPTLNVVKQVHNMADFGYATNDMNITNTCQFIVNSICLVYNEKVTCVKFTSSLPFFQWLMEMVQ